MTSYIEKIWSKRDAFILMDCDQEEYANSPQRCATYLLLKKTTDSVALIDEFLWYAQDPRIITDMPNQLGKENYDGFQDNRHDQTVWSLLTKKHNIKSFRDPSQHHYDYPKDILDRSTYPTIICSHRRNMRSRMFTPLVPQLIFVAQNLIPKEFREALALLVEDYVKLRDNLVFPSYMPSSQQILENYKKLNMPETPFLKELLSKGQ